MKITLSELRQIVKSIINEQLTSQPANNPMDNISNPNYEGGNFKGRTVQFYSDKANTALLFTAKITEVYPAHQGNNWTAVEIQTNKGKDYPILFRCDLNAFTYRGPETQNKPTYIYSNKFMSEVKPLCAKK